MANLDNLERIELDLGSLGRVRLIALEGREALSTLFEYRGRARVPVSIERGGGGAVRPERVAADHATITLRDVWGSERRVRGLVSEVEVEVHDVGEATVHFALRPELFRLTLGRSCRSFQELDVLEIAQEVFARANLEVLFDIGGSYEKRAYTVQYNESDFDFVSRLFEEEGLFYWFDHAEGSMLVVCDRSPGSPDLDGAGWTGGAPRGPGLIYRPELGLESDRPFIRELGPRPRALPGKFSLGSFDFARPAFKVAAAETTDTTEVEVYDAPGAGLSDPRALANRARIGAERAKAFASRVQGSSPSVRLCPGRAFELAGHPFARMDGRFVVLETTLRVEEREAPIELTYVALPIDVPFRPLAVTPPPKHPGLQTGVVIGPGGAEIHTDSHGRVRLQQHWDRDGAKDEAAGRWVRVAQRGVAGSMMFPRMGWNVLSFAEEGSVDAPVVMARTFDGDHPPPYALPENKTRLAYRTATSPGGGTFNEVRFEDKKGAEEMFINSTGDMHVLIKDTKGEVVHGTMVHKVGVDHTLEVGGTYDVQIDGSQTVSVGANQSEHVHKDRQKLVNGSEAIRVGTTRALKTGVNADTTGEARALKVGAVHLSATLGAIKAQSKVMNQLVGGAVVKATPRTMTEAVGSEVNADTVIGYLPEKAQAAIGKLKKIPGVSSQLAKLKKKAGLAIQTIGVLKFEQGKDRKIEVKNLYSENVLGQMTLTAAEALGDTAKLALSFTTGGLAGKTKSVLIKSETEVQLKSGDTTIVVNKDGVKIDAPEIQLGTATGFVVPNVKVEINP